MADQKLTSINKFWYLRDALEVMFWPVAASTTTRWALSDDLLSTIA